LPAQKQQDRNFPETKAEQPQGDSTREGRKGMNTLLCSSVLFSNQSYK